MLFVVKERLTVSSCGSRGEALGGPGPPLSLDQIEAQRVEKNFFRDLPLSQGLDDQPPLPPPNPYLKIWIHPC